MALGCYHATKEYRGHTGSVDWSPDDNCFFGKVQGIRDLVSYEGETLQELERDFREAVDDYICLLPEIK